MRNVDAINIETKIHGSYLIQQSENKKESPLLVGFHGYGETAEDQMQLLKQIPGIENWAVCSVQALHPFYNTRAKIGYSWMTSQNRDLHIEENVEYVNMQNFHVPIYADRFHRTNAANLCCSSHLL